MPAIIADETGILAAEAITEITKGISRNVAVIDYATGISPDHWATFREGGWDLLGAPGDAGGAGLELRDLVEVAFAWGQRILPLPLMPTIFAKRWSAAARAWSGPLTYSIAEADGPSAAFAGFPGIRLLAATDPSDDELLTTGPEGRLDEFAPTLARRSVSAVTRMSEPARHELVVSTAAEAIGCARRLLGDATEYAKTREQFGRPIGHFQAIKHHLANAHISLELATTAVCWAALEPESYFAPTRIAFDEAQRAAELCMQVYGGIGFTWEMGLHFFLRHLLSLRATVDSLAGGSW